MDFPTALEKVIRERRERESPTKVPAPVTQAVIKTPTVNAPTAREVVAKNNYSTLVKDFRDGQRVPPDKMILPILQAADKTLEDLRRDSKR